MTPTATDFFSGRLGPDAADAERRFYAALKMRNGTFKTTGAARFEDVEAAFAPLVAARAGRIGKVLDVGASTGVTTRELAGWLARQGAAAEVTGTDLFLDAHIVDLGPGLRVLADSSGHPLQYDVGGLSIRAWTRRLDYLTPVAPLLWAARRLAATRARRAILARRCRPVRLVAPGAASGRVRFIENDVFRRTEAFVGAFDLVRAANLLNRDYFAEPDLSRGLDNLLAYLGGPGALLWLARTRIGAGNEATLFEVTPDRRLTVLARVGRGSELEDLVSLREAAPHVRTPEDRA